MKSKLKWKLRKDQCLILVLAGILLCVIALPVDNKNSGSSFMRKSDLSNAKSDMMQSNSDAAAIAETFDSEGGGTSSYNSYWEKRLEESLTYVEGAGEVRVLITLKESEGKVVEKDETNEQSETVENDSAGGNRQQTESRAQSDTIYTVNEQGKDVPYVVKTTAPIVEGVVVIAEGGDNLAVRQNIIEAIQVLFDIDVNNIRVVKMKKKNQ